MEKNKIKSHYSMVRLIQKEENENLIMIWSQANPIMAYGIDLLVRS